MKAFKAGLLRKRVTIVQPANASDSFGQPIQSGTPVSSYLVPPTQPNPAAVQGSPITYGPFWASIEPMSGDEPEVAEQLRGQTLHKVTMRSVASIVAITPAMQVLYQGRTLNIKQIIDVDELHYWLELVCVEVTTATV